MGGVVLVGWGGGGGIYPPVVGGDIGAGGGNRYFGCFLGRTHVFGGGWYGYTGQNILALYGR